MTIRRTTTKNLTVTLPTTENYETEISVRTEGRYLRLLIGEEVVCCYDQTDKEALQELVSCFELLRNEVKDFLNAAE